MGKKPKKTRLVAGAKLKTRIPELQAQPLQERELIALLDAVKAVSRIQEEQLNSSGGARLVWHIEIAAAFLSTAIDHSGVSAEDTGAGHPEILEALCVDIVTRRAREIVKQGHA